MNPDKPSSKFMLLIAHSERQHKIDSYFPNKNLDKAELSGRKNNGLRFRNPDSSLRSATLIIG